MTAFRDNPNANLDEGSSLHVVLAQVRDLVEESLGKYRWGAPGEKGTKDEKAIDRWGDTYAEAGYVLYG